LEKINFSELKIEQLGYVYKNIEKHAKLMEKTLGLPKFQIIDVPNLETKFRDKSTKVDIKVGFSKLGTYELELIQWVNGDSIYKEFIEQGKEGLHHYGIYIDNLELYSTKMKEMGFQSVNASQFAALKWDYFDTTEVLGVCLEFIEKIKMRERKKR
jgi:methylmalonyl-CoA/ethylmalonyl-CoA epimerase